MAARLLPAGAGWLLPTVLSTTAGAVDVIGFLALGGLFTAHITGNVVVVAAHHVTGGFGEVGPLLAVPVFVAVLGAMWVAIPGGGPPTPLDSVARRRAAPAGAFQARHARLSQREPPTRLTRRDPLIPLRPVPRQFGDAARLHQAGPRAKLRAVTEYVEDHLDSAPTLEQMAAIARLSPNYFARLFQRATGLPPHRYVITRRVERAKQLLQTRSDFSLAEVAASADFSDQSQFCYHFKRLVGVTPGQFRRSARIA
jgi:AraC-like DNA-binding protein